MSTEIVKRTTYDVLLTDPKKREEFYKAVLASEAMKKRGKLADIMVKVQAGAEMGMSPFVAITSFEMVDGQLTLSARAMAAMVSESPNYRYRHNEGKSTDDLCVIDWHEKLDGKWEKIGSSSFSMDEARLQGLTSKDNWKKAKADMLWARALSRGFRRFTANLAKGAPVYVGDEMGADEEISKRPLDETTDAEYTIQQTNNDNLPTVQQLRDAVTAKGANLHAIVQYFGMTDVKQLTPAQRFEAIRTLNLNRETHKNE